jgi:xanthine dehydrogenase small subunit
VLVGEIVDGEMQYESMTSCLMPVANANGKHIVSIEGINFSDTLNPVQQAMADEGATQCGFCTPGFVMSLAGFCLQNNTETSPANAIAAVDGNICRCTGYKSIERAACKVADMMKEKNGEPATTFVSRKKILPEYFSNIKDQLQNLEPTPPDKYRDTTHLPIAIGTPLTFLGGGTDLYVQKHDEMTHAASQYLFDQPELNGISEEGNKCIIGPSVTVTDLKNAEVIRKAFPDFQRYAKLVSSTPIRNMATIAGNFINASPIGDFTIFFLALDAQLVLRSQPQTPSSEGRVRVLPLRKLYKGYKQLDKKPDEYIEQISFEIPETGSCFNFEKVSKRTHLDIASVNSAILLKMKGDAIKEANLSAGGVGPVPMYLQKTSAFLKGKKINEETIKGAIEIMQTEISPISDVRGSKEYKTLLLGQLIKSHFITLFPEASASSA